MTRRSVLSLSGVWAMTLAFGSVAMAHPGHEHKIMGTVTMAAPDHVMLKDNDGKDATVTINKDTKFLRAKKAMTAADMKAGMGSSSPVTFADDDKSIAKVIELGAAPATK